MKLATRPLPTIENLGPILTRLEAIEEQRRVHGVDMSPGGR